MKNNTVCFVAGRSGGHIIPCLTLAQRAKESNAATQVLFFTTTTLLDSQIIGDNKKWVDTHVSLPLETIQTRTWYGWAYISFLIIKSFCISVYYLYQKKPAKVISTGGYIAVPVCLAAKLLRIPVELYELNVQPGKAVAWLAPYVEKVTICFKKTAYYLAPVSCTVAEYPVRFTNVDKEYINKEVAHTEKDDCGVSQLDPARKTIFILGGSQGSHFINEAIEQVIVNDVMLRERITIIHQTGLSDPEYWHALYAHYAIPAYTFAFSSHLAPYYMRADLIISRAGAGALFEIRFFNKPCIIIPLETEQNNHQYANAQEMVVQNQRLFSVIRQEAIKKEGNALAQGIRKMLTF